MSRAGTAGRGRPRWTKTLRSRVRAELLRSDALSERREVSLLTRSGLFDPAWYAATAGCDVEPSTAARHFLSEGCAQGHTPHPLFDQRHFMKREPGLVGQRNPLVAYLEDVRLHRVSTHRLFDLRGYRRRYPQARRYPRGALLHYLDLGASQGLAPNGWYRPDPAAEPGGLADWVRARRREWVVRREATSSGWSTEPPAGGRDRHPTPPADALVSVLVPAGGGSTLLADTVTSVLRQTWTRIEVLLLHEPGRADEVWARAGEGARTDRRVRLVEVATGWSAALAGGESVAVGEWLAFARPPARWLPDHLLDLLQRARREGSVAARDVVERREASGELRFLVGPATTARSLVAPQVALDSLVVRRDAVSSLGGLDAAVHRALPHRLELQLLERGPIPLVETVGVRTAADLEDALREEVPALERSDLDVEELEAWHQVVLASHLVDWPALRARSSPEAGLVSVLVPTYDDSRMTVRAVRSVLAARDEATTAWRVAGAPPAEEPARVEVVVVDNGCGALDAAVLDALAVELAEVRVVHQPVNRGFALGNTVGLPECRGDVLVFLNNDTEVTTGWLAPLLTALEDPDVHGAQSLLRYPSGTIQSAGTCFPVGGGVPHILLRGFPVEDAVGIEHERFAAATAAALAMRRRDVVELEGFDALFRNGMEDVDLGLRMCAARSGHFVVRPDSVVVHHESKTPGRFASSTVNRSLLLLRWGDAMPRDDVRLWAGRGYRVTGHQVGRDVAADRRVAALVPVLARLPRPHVSEGVPSLRWALKIPAPATTRDERAGETRLARDLAAALRRLGQEVVVDHRDEFDRASGQFDDVALVLRGDAPFRPAYGQVNLAWVVSHPGSLPRREAQAYDRVFAASLPWSLRTAREWGIRVDPLLPAIDPGAFPPVEGGPETGGTLVFVGRSHGTVRPMVALAAEARLPLSIVGEDWEELAPAADLRPGLVTAAQRAGAYAGARVVLHDHAEDRRLGGFLSHRLFEAVASGARVVTDDVAGLEGLFGRSVQVARTAAELAALTTGRALDDVFGGPEERQAVAAAVREAHSFDDRAATLLAAATELRRPV